MPVNTSAKSADRESLHLALIPAGDEATASSRIRIYGMLPWLRKAGVTYSLEPNPKANAFYVQKRVTPELVAAVGNARKFGIPIIYDIDDLGPALSYWTPPQLLEEMIHLAHVLTTDTANRKQLVEARYPQALIEVFPPLVDYSPLSPQPMADLPDDDLRVLWFGCTGNLSLFDRYAHALAACNRVKIVVIADDAFLTVASRFPDVEFIPWKLESFTNALRSCHVSCLMHDGSDADRSKSNNKMITSITWGVPAIVSDTPEYSRTARICGVPEAVFSGPEDLARTITGLRSSLARQAYLDKAQPVIWSNQSPEIITGKFIALVKRVIAGQY